jgi:two-component system, OmpR family, sensor histidine kinase KdpD
MSGIANRVSQRIWRIAGAVAAIAVETVAFTRMGVVNGTTVAIGFLLTILAIATGWGLAEAIIASLAGAICFSLFLPPVGFFWVSEPENWLAFAAFLTTGVIASQLSSSAKKQAREATRRRSEMEKLYELSRALLQTRTEESIGRRLAQQIHEVFGVQGVAVLDGLTREVYRAGPQAIDVSESSLHTCAARGTPYRDPATGVAILPISLGGPQFGSLALTAGSISEAAQNSIASLAAVALERSRTQELASRADAARQSQELKSMLLDAIAHEFKTPLTSIKVAVSLLAGDRNASGKEPLSIVEEETERLETLITEAIEMARIEAGKLRLERQRHSVAGVLHAALQKMALALKEHGTSLEIPEGLPDVLVDQELFGLAIRQLVGNAVKYTQPESPIMIRAAADNGMITIVVADRGPGIPEKDQERIFERFYRIPETSFGVPGTGMGLTIAREIVEAHGGRLWLQSTPGQGSEFYVTVPCFISEMKP